TLSGISVDMQFRGHACAPHLVSADVATAFRTGKVDINAQFWPRVWGEQFPAFRESFDAGFQHLSDQFGCFTDAEHHLLYIMYVIGPRHFSGELTIADHYTTVRVPSWDRDIVDLSFSIRESALSFSEFTSH